MTSGFCTLIAQRVKSDALLCFLALFFATAATVASAQIRATDPDLKAAIIVSMLMFVEWPDSQNLPPNKIQVCYLDNSPVAEALSRMEGKRIRNKTLKVTKISSDRMEECHAIYLSPANRSVLPTVLDTLRTLPVLIAGDSPDYFPQGVMLNIDLASGHAVFDINLRSVTRVGLQISSKALHLSRQVIE